MVQSMVSSYSWLYTCTHNDNFIDVYMGDYSFIFYIAGFLLLIPLWTYMAVVRNLIGARLQKASIEACDCSAIPDFLHEFHLPAEQQLLELGFAPMLCAILQDMLVSDYSQRWVKVYKHAQSKAYAELYFTTHPAEIPGHELVFSNLFSDGTVLATLNSRQHLLPVQLDNIIYHDEHSESIAEQWQAHQAKLNELGSSKQSVDIDRETYLATSDKFAEQLHNTLLNSNWMHPVSETQYKLNFFKACRFAYRIRKGEMRLRSKLQNRFREILQNKQQPDYPLQVDVYSYKILKSLQDKQPNSRLLKTLLFLLSVVVFSAVFGVIFSWQTVLIIIGVLLFHEFGHLAAMKLFNYRDLQILFIPFFGAAAMGREQDVKPYQKVIIAFAGPVPGIILGGLLLPYALSSGSAVLLQTVIIMLVLNYINLLPIMPLDGGRIFNTIFLEKFPRGQAWFNLLSIIMLVLLALLFHEPILWIISVVLLLTLPHMFKQGNQLLRLQRYLASQGAGSHADLQSIFAALRQPEFHLYFMPEKFALVNSYEENRNKTHARPATVILALLVFILAMSYPIALIYKQTANTLQGNFLSNIISSLVTSAPDTVQTEAPAWDQQLATAANDAQRWQVAIQAGDYHYGSETYFDAPKYYAVAIGIAENFQQHDIRLAQTLIRQARSTEQYATMQKYYTHALNLLATHHPQSEVYADTLIEVAENADNYDKAQRTRAIQYLQQGIALKATLATATPSELAQDEQINAYQQLVHLYESDDQWDKALATQQQVLALSETLTHEGFRYRLVQAYAGLAQLYALQNDRQRALQLLEQRLNFLLTQKDNTTYEYLSAAQRDLGWLKTESNNYTAALVHFDKAIEYRSEAMRFLNLGNKRADYALAPLLLDKAYVHLQDNNTAAALTLLRRVREINKPIYAEIDAYIDNLRRSVEHTHVNLRKKWFYQRHSRHIEMLQHFKSVLQ